MSLNKTHKTFIFCIIFIIGVCLTLLNLNIWYMLASLPVITYFVYKKLFSIKFLFVCFCILIFSVFSTNSRLPNPDILSKLAPTQADLTGRIISQPVINSKNTTKFELEVYSCKISNKNFKPIKAKTLVSIFNKKDLIKNVKIGDWIQLAGIIKQPHRATNPGEFDYGKYLRNSEIFTITQAKYKNIKIIKHPESGKWFLRQQFSKIKDKILSIHAKCLKSPNLEILGGIVLGNHAIPTPENIKQDFINSGLLHLLAASGMNVAFISLLWLFIAKKLNFPYKSSMIIAMILALAYGALAEFPPSVVRAVFMFEFIMIGKLLDRQADNILLLILSCTAMMLFNPMIASDIGFQLSFLVTLGLLIYTPILLEKTKPIPEIISGTILIPAIAQLWASPIQIFHFNNFALYSILANIIVVPLVLIVNFLGFISTLFCLIPVIGEKTCYILDKLAEPFIIFLINISKFISNLPDSLQYFATPSIISIFLFYILILLMAYAIKLNFSKKILNIIILGISLILILLLIPLCSSKHLKVIFFDVGEADSIFIQTPNNKNILVDTANCSRYGYSSAKSIMIPYFRDTGINKIDAMILTHPDKDHICGTIDLFKHIKVAKVYDNGEKSKTKTYKRIKNYINKNKIPNEHSINEQEINLDKNVKIRIIKPLKNSTSSKNDNSIILYIVYNKFSMLLMGDNNAKSLSLIKKYVKEPVDVLKVGHHGGYNTVNDDFIRYLQPKEAIISVGKNNNYSHPNPRVLETLKKFKIKTLRTDMNQAIHIQVK